MIICDKPMYKAFKKPISRRNMPQLSTKLLNNIKTDLQQSKSFHRRWMDIPKHILLCIALRHYKKYSFWTTLLQYIFDLIMPQITSYSVNASVLDSEFVSIWPEYNCWFKSHLLKNDAPVSVSCAERKCIYSPVLEKLVQAQLIRVLDTRPLVTIRRSRVWSHE